MNNKRNNMNNKRNNLNNKLNNMNNVVFFIIILNMLFLLFYCCSMLLSLSLERCRTGHGDHRPTMVCKAIHFPHLISCY